MSKYPDISHYHPVNNWAAAKASCPFLISKATQGTKYVDPTLESFIAGCEENKIPYWLYTYLNKGNETEQADFLIRKTVNKVGKYFVGYILDVEAGNNADDVQEALTYLNAHGTKTMIYTMYSQYSKYRGVIQSRPDKCAWWEARYGKNNGVYNVSAPCHNGADLHQFTSKGTCPGISGECDLNRIVRKGEEWFRTPLSSEGSVKTVKVTLNELRTGSTGGNVKSLQILLNGKGYKCGSCDGDFGNKTLAAVKAYQKDAGLVVDGIVGAKTWAALLG